MLTEIQQRDQIKFKIVVAGLKCDQESARAINY